LQKPEINYAMKKTLFLFLFACAILSGKAQDIIITINNDTIECHIIDVNADRISYEQNVIENQKIGKSISTSEVLQYFRSGERERMKQILEHRFLITAQGGLSHSFTDLSNFKNMLTSAGVPGPEANDYTGKLKNGIFLNAGFHYLLTKFFGAGAEYSFFQSSSKGEFIVRGYSGLNVPVYSTKTLNERIYSNFAGPSFLLQLTPGTTQNIKISATVSPGVVFFRDETRGNEYQYFLPADEPYSVQYPQYYNHLNTLAQGTTFGAKSGLSMEYVITRQLSAGIAGSFMWAQLHKISVKNLNYDSGNQELEKSINISHLDYGISIRYNF
jgi:hypothetical protein